MPNSCTAKNPYAKESKKPTETPTSITEEMDMEKASKPVATKIKNTKITEMFPSKQSVSFADAPNGKTFEHIMQKYTRQFAVSFNVQIKIDGQNDG